MSKLKAADVYHVIIARHGSTAGNRGGVGKDFIRGQGNYPLTDQGKQESRDLAAHLVKTELPVRLVVTSDLSRAYQTAVIVSQASRCPILKIPDLRAWNLGPSIQGKTVTPELVATVKQWVLNNNMPPSGERFNAYVFRYLSALSKQLKKVVAQAVPDTNVCIINHGRGVRLAELWLQADPSGQSTTTSVDALRQKFADNPTGDALQPGGYINLSYSGGKWHISGVWKQKEGAGYQIAVS